MVHKLLVFVVFIIFLIFSGCGNESIVHTESTENQSLEEGSKALAKHHVSRSNVYTFATGEMVGTSKVVRSPNGVSMSLQTSGINDGNAVTVWYVVFNEPGKCGTSPCGEADIFNPATRTDVLYAAGHVVGNGNHANFASHRSVGDNSGSVMPFFNAWLGTNLPSVGLENSLSAEVHLVVRTHEEAIPEFLPDMILTFNGGCGYPPGVPTDFGAPGPNSCVDIQFAIHQP